MKSKIGLATPEVFKFTFFVMCEIDEQNSMVRLVTSWATDEDQVKMFIKNIVFE